MVSLKIWYKDSGHSVAFYWRPGPQLYLFDPNLGVFLFKEWKDCEKAFCYSFSEGYAPSDSANKRGYRRLCHQ